MPVIGFASPKGGAGKSTSAVVLATQLALKRASVTAIDADPVQTGFPMGAKTGLPSEHDCSRRYLGSINHRNYRTGGATTHVCGRRSGRHGLDDRGVRDQQSRPWIVPTQGSQLDAFEAAKAVKLIRQQEKAFGRTIPYALLFTRTNAAIRPRTLQHIRDEFKHHNVPSLRTQMHEREAFRAIFSFGGTLEFLDATQVSNRDAAIKNARELAGEILTLLRENADSSADSSLAQEVA